MPPADPDKKPDVEKTTPESDGDDNPTQEEGARTKEIGGRGGLDPTRYGDWEKGGRCIDF